MANDRSAAPSHASERAADVEGLKRAAARAAAQLVQDGMRVGLGTGSTVAHLLPALAERGLQGLRCVATSPATAKAAAPLGLHVVELDELGGELDIAIDGADQIDPHGWVVKGGGAAHTREKIVAAAARRFIVIASTEKSVPALSPPIPLEILRFGSLATLAALSPARLREVPPSPDGNLIADYLGAVGNPRELSIRLSQAPGLVEHGLFEPELISELIVAGEDGVQRRPGGKPEG